MHMAGQERRLQNDDTSAVHPDRLDRLYTTWKICGIFAAGDPVSGICPLWFRKGSQCIRGGKSTETAVSLRSAGDIWLYLSRNGTDPVKIPDRLLLLCMDLGGGTPDSIDRMGSNGLSVQLIKREKPAKRDGCADPNGHPVPGWKPGVGMDRGTDNADTGTDGNARTATGNSRQGNSGAAFCIQCGKRKLTGIQSGAPKEVMEAARAYSAEIHPVYGRSIWDASLGSYSYDTYETWQEDMYLWMSHLETTEETEYLRTDENTTTEAGGRKIDFAACLVSAGKAGIDYILLPEDLSEDVQKELQEAADGRLRSFGGYFLIVM